MRKLLIMVINYANEEEVLQFAQEIEKQSVSEQIGLAIVSNKKSEKPKVDLATELGCLDLATFLYEPPNNLGYLNGALYGYNKYIEENNDSPEWAIVSNTDIEISDSRFFEKVLAKQYNEDIWCLAPSVYSPNKNSYDNPHYATRCSLEKINRIIWLNERPNLAWIYANLADIKAKFNKSSKRESQYVYSVHGCFFMLRKEFIEKLRYEEYKGFLYSEEAYVAENLLISGKKAYYDSTIELIHKEHSVTGLIGIKKRSKYIANSLKYIREEFYLKG